MSYLQMRRTYVIEKMPMMAGGHTYGAFWPDTQSYTGFHQRMIISCDTVTEIKELMGRHYPGSECTYEPEDTTGIIAEATRALKGEG